MQFYHPPAEGGSCAFKCLLVSVSGPVLYKCNTFKLETYKLMTPNLKKHAPLNVLSFHKIKTILGFIFYFFGVLFCNVFFYLNPIAINKYCVNWYQLSERSTCPRVPRSSRLLVIEQSFHYLALYGRLAEGAIHWSVHLSLSCPLYLTDKINGKHPERTWTQRCISACQSVQIALATSI